MIIDTDDPPGKNLRTIKMRASQGGIVFLLLFAALTNWATASTQCQTLNVGNVKKIRIVKNTGLAINLEKFGGVCLLGRLIRNPFPDGAYGIGPSGPNAPYIQFSLVRNGSIIYDLPRPPDWLWGSFDNAIVATTVIKNNKNESSMFVVIGQTTAPNGSDLFQPLVYNLTRNGFELDLNLSKDLVEFEIYRMNDLVKKINEMVEKNAK
jgi:hypothetical protein